MSTSPQTSPQLYTSVQASASHNTSSSILHNHTKLTSLKHTLEWSPNSHSLQNTLTAQSSRSTAFLQPVSHNLHKLVRQFSRQLRHQRLQHVFRFVHHRSVPRTAARVCHQRAGRGFEVVTVVGDRRLEGQLSQCDVGFMESFRHDGHHLLVAGGCGFAAAVQLVTTTYKALLMHLSNDSNHYWCCFKVFVIKFKCCYSVLLQRPVQ